MLDDDCIRQAYVRVLCVLIKCVSDNSYLIAFTLILVNYKIRKFMITLRLPSLFFLY